jgi:hypothetical protein
LNLAVGFLCSKALKAAKDAKMLPNGMDEKNIEIHKDNLPNRFASYFVKKVKDVLNDVKIYITDYNGTKKFNSEEGFVDRNSIKKCLHSPMPKNS